MACAFTFSDVSLHYSEKYLLDKVNLTISDGDRIGVVGRNGAGKSSFLRLLAGVEEPDLGEVSRRRGLIVGYLREKCPGATLCLQHTWAYEHDSPHWAFMRYHRDQQEMYERLSAAYKAMAEKYGLVRIPSGEVVQRLRNVKPWRVGERSICRDGFHMDLIFGRYALACTWARKLAGVKVTGNPFNPSPEGGVGTAALLRIIQKVVDEMVEPA